MGKDNISKCDILLYPTFGEDHQSLHCFYIGRGSNIRFLPNVEYPNPIITQGLEK